jgi:hypothetical protein
MPQFFVDEDLAAAIEKLANPKPFEHLSFNTALRRVIVSLTAKTSQKPSGDDLSVSRIPARRALTPNSQQWAASIPELRDIRNLTSWKAICDHLKINPAGDSARRKLDKWVKENKPHWPDVPNTGSA